MSYIRFLLFTLAISIFSAVTIAKTHITTLQSDGPNKGLSAYELIKNFGGKRSIESPDLYPQNHPDVPHIYEETDDKVGHHFVFLLHRDLDKDRDKYVKFSDRQRNEIKAYDKSIKALKGYEGETLTYRWKFKLENNMSLSKNFSHFFQLKSVDDGVGMPIFTFSGRSYKGQKWFAMSHAAVLKADILDKILWQDIAGTWLEAECTATFGNNGKLNINIKRLSNNKTIMSYKSDNIDMWRGTKPAHFVRPKWGLYRSLKTKEMLENEQDTIRFADFQVKKSAP
ncbi:heparin lyase I family protein [Paraglaciecola sp.]|uniref:heparin lyase I family protein n=1 Tax=Paraglaciecola sp. TaxID=1920173 RepID=UPI003EF363F4